MKNTFTCVICGKEYTSYKERSYCCSKECQSIYRESRKIPCKCDYCGKEMKILPSVYNISVNRGLKKHYCSKECANKGAITSKTVKCKNCGKEFTRFPSMIFENNYCSHQCYNDYKLKNTTAITKICPICNKEFTTYHSKQVCCSRECGGKLNQKRLTCTCANCGESFDRIISEVKKAKLHFCSDKCKNEYRSWDDSDIEILKKYYKKVSSYEISEVLLEGRHEPREVRRKAATLGLSENPFWTKEEEQILKDNYSKIPMDELRKLLPNRSLSAIIGKSNQYGLTSYFNINKFYTDEENKYLRDNYLTKTDKEIATYLNRTISAIQQRLCVLNLYRPFDPKQKTYKDLNAFVRARIYTWKNIFREKHNYTCAITGSRSNIIVHHCRSFNLLIEETVDVLNFQLKDRFQDYTEDELNEFVDTFMEIQDNYDACVCITEEIHKLFHKEYGYGNNTEEQWEEFVTNYHNGKYDNVA